MAIDDNTSYELTGYQVKDLANKVRGKADSNSLASVATSGLYSDLIGKPTIPTVNNGTLTIQHNGTSAGTFTANQSTNSTVNIETIYADDYIDTTALTPIISTSMIDDEAVTTAKIDDEAVTTAKIDDEAVTAAKIDWDSVTIIIDDNVTTSAFFNGSYSKTFTVPVDGYYEINAPFSELAHKQANAIYYFRHKVDNVEKKRYVYASVNSDTDWGTCRRTITSTPFTMYLAAGQHTFSTTDGNFWDTTYSLMAAPIITARLIKPVTS